MDSVHNSYFVLQKTNESIKDAMAILEPLFNIWSTRGPLFEKLELLQPRRTDIPKSVTEVGEKIEKIGTTWGFFKGKRN